jgi:hypothetical protein
LLLEIGYLVDMSIAPRGILRFELILQKNVLSKEKKRCVEKKYELTYLEIGHGLGKVHITRLLVVYRLLCNWKHASSGPSSLKKTFRH